MLQIHQGKNIHGTVVVWGAKNAALPIYAARNLFGNRVTLDNIPNISDIVTMQTIIDDADQRTVAGWSWMVVSDLCSKLRASILLIPNGLLTHGSVAFYGTGWCKIGKRPVDTFDNAFIEAWVTISYNEYKNYVVTWLPKKKIILQEPSVTATEAILTYLSFCEASYDVDLYHAAIEPHVMNHVAFLQTMWAKIVVHHDHHFTISPVPFSSVSSNIQTISFPIIWDSLEALFYCVIGATVPGGDVVVKGFDVNELNSIWVEFDKIGIDYTILDEHSVKVTAKNKGHYNAIKMQTMIYPWLPTDAQPMLGALLTQCNGVSHIHEKMYEWRFWYLAELSNLWASFEVLNPHQVNVNGPTALHGGYLGSTDLRWGAAAIICAILADWVTHVSSEEWVLRGYENVVEKLTSLWVEIASVPNQ